MKFLKENSYDIVRLFINQVGITIFSLVLYTALSSIEDLGLHITLKVLVSVFSTCFYFVLLYTVSWDYGAKDKVRIDSGRYQISKFKGLYLGLLANAVNFILSALAIASIAIYIKTSAEWLFTAFGIINLIMRFFLSAYLGMIQGMTASLSGNVDYLCESFAYFAFPFLAVFVVVFGYAMGMKNKRIFSSNKNKQ